MPAAVQYSIQTKYHPWQLVYWQLKGPTDPLGIIAVRTDQGGVSIFNARLNLNLTCSVILIMAFCRWIRRY